MSSKAASSRMEPPAWDSRCLVEKVRLVSLKEADRKELRCAWSGIQGVVVFGITLRPNIDS